MMQLSTCTLEAISPMPVSPLRCCAARVHCLVLGSCSQASLFLLALCNGLQRSCHSFEW